MVAASAIIHVPVEEPSGSIYGVELTVNVFSVSELACLIELSRGNNGNMLI